MSSRALILATCFTVIAKIHVANCAPTYQQGNKLVGTTTWPGLVYQGTSVALSADGNTAIVGGPSDNAMGAAWIFSRSSGVWTQQGAKLVGSNAYANADQGVSVALSADGNTAIVGGYSDNAVAGAAWVFTRSGGVWTQQGTKLIGTDASGAACQGKSVALSSDGNTALVGGYRDSNYEGAAWVYMRSGGVWSQQGTKLVGTGAVGAAGQGWSVALSADGNTAIVGGFTDNSYCGAAWVFTRSGGVWAQQGTKLVDTSAAGSNQGISVAISGDGSTAMVGGDLDATQTGAAWVYTLSGGVWSQQGLKLVGNDATGQSFQGSGVALSSDGNTAIVGGKSDYPNGAAWIFTRSAGVWSQAGPKLVGSGASGTSPDEQGYSVALSADGTSAIVGGKGDNADVGAAWVFVDQVPPLMVEEVVPVFAIGSVYPNPASRRIAIAYELPAEGRVRLEVYDLSGRLVRRLADGNMCAGEHDSNWDVIGSDGVRARPGIYYLALRFGGRVVERRVAILN